MVDGQKARRIENFFVVKRDMQWIARIRPGTDQKVLSLDPIERFLLRIEDLNLFFVYKGGAAKKQLNFIFLKLTKELFAFLFQNTMETIVKIVDRNFLNLFLLAVKTALV